MLIGLITAWLLVGGRSGSSLLTAAYVDQVTTYANAQINDKSQRAALLDAAKQLKRAGEEEARASAKAAGELVKIAKNRQAKSEDYDSALSQLRGYSIQLQQRAVQQRFQLKSKLTREQWVALHATVDGKT